MIEVQKTYQQWGKTFRLRFMPYNSGILVAGYEVYAYIMRTSDGAFFDFNSYDANPNNTVWLTTGSFPGDLTHLRKILPEYKIGSISMYYGFEWNFPNNIEKDDTETYQIFYYNPTSGIIGTEEVTYIPKTMNFNVYSAQPAISGNIVSISG